MDPKEIMGKLIDEYAADQKTVYLVRETATGKVVYRTDYAHFAESWVDLQLNPDFYDIEVSYG